MSLLSVQNLHVGYTYDIVRNVSFDLKAGEILAIVGESGSGKSTLLKSLIGGYPGAGVVSKGRIIYRGKDIVKMNKKELSKIRGLDISMIFQSPGATLNPVRSIGSQFIETICFHTGLTCEEAYEQATAIMEKLGLRDPDRIMKGYAFQLSGGMKQRVSIAMALAMRPKILLADEPTSALDATVQKAVVKELMKLHHELGTAIVIVTHNITLSSYMADRIAVMYAGEMVEIGEKSMVINNPLHPYTQALIDSIPDIKGRKKLKGIEGQRVKWGTVLSGCSFANRCPQKKEMCFTKRPELINSRPEHCYACNN